MTIQENKNNTVRMPILAREIAAALGPEWSSADSADYGRGPFLTGPDDTRIRVGTTARGNGEPGRVFLTGIAPRALQRYLPPSKGYTTVISVSASKTPTQIAREIQRRLLPGYTAFLAAAQAEKTRHEQRTTLLAELGTRLGAHASASRIDEHLYLADHDHGGTVSVPYGGTHVHFNLRFPPAQALELASMIATLRAAAS